MQLGCNEVGRREQHNLERCLFSFFVFALCVAPPSDRSSTVQTADYFKQSSVQSATAADQVVITHPVSDQLHGIPVGASLTEYASTAVLAMIYEDNIFTPRTSSFSQRKDSNQTRYK